MNGVISARDLSKRYGGVRAVDGVSFDIDPGRIVGLIGPNGAGKTSLLKAVLGLTPYEGSLQVLGFDPYRQRHELMQQVSFIADVSVLPRWLRVEQALDLLQAIHPRFDRSKAEHFLSRTSLRRRARVGTLSKGMIVQLHLALVMAIDARLMVLDEPTLGLDILYRKEFYTALLNDYFDEQRTILVTTHQVEELEHILTDLIFIDRGRIVLAETMESVADKFIELTARPDRVEAARTLSPLYERQMLGRTVFLYDGVPGERLRDLGDTRTPSIADLFVAKIKGAAA